MILNKKDDDDKLLKKIKKVLLEDDTVLFLGSGISMWSGLPSWYGLIEELAKYVEDEGYDAEDILLTAQSNLLVAASLGVNKLSKQQFGIFIRQACRLGKAVPDHIHYKLVRLGPSCFITTNYDCLIETAFQRVFENKALTHATNRKIPECSIIKQASARNFIFKPHGDVNDTESIILSNEQYQGLYSDKKVAIETLKILVSTRPIVFVGFGLQDPDFIYMMNEIKSIFKDSSIQHYAIMPDINASQKEFWLQGYNIRVLGYKTVKLSNGEKSHEEIFNILDALVSDKEEKSEVALESDQNDFNNLDDTEKLALLKYSNNIKLNLKQSLSLIIPMKVRKKDKGFLQNSTDINTTLNDANKIILLGRPGYGKTFSLRQHCFKLAEKLFEGIISEKCDIEDLQVPVYLDLKTYNGDLWEMIDKQFPNIKCKEKLIKLGKITFVLDGYNEVPNKFFADRQIQGKLKSFADSVSNCKVIISSRTEETLDNLSYDFYSIEEIDKNFVVEYITKLGKNIPKKFDKEIINTLRKPIFFKLLSENKIRVEESKTPTYIYKSYFSNISEAFNKKFKLNINLENVFKPIAYSLIEEGSEAFSIIDLENQIKDNVIFETSNNYDLTTIVNWLIESQEILVSLPNYKLCFFHQSITEYLAALELSILYKASSSVLRRCLRFRRWDYVLLMVVEFLDGEEVNDFIKDIIRVDILLAMRASKYCESEQGRVSAFILDCLLANFKSVSGYYKYQIENLIKDIPVTYENENNIRQLIRFKNSIGGAATALLLKINKEKTKNEVINELFLNPDKFNYCKEIGYSLRGNVDFDEAINLLERVRDDYTVDVEGLTSGIEKILSYYNSEDILQKIGPFNNLNDNQITILLNILHDNKSIDNFKILINLVMDGNKKAIFYLYCLVDDLNVADDYLYSNEFLDKVIDLINIDSGSYVDYGIELIEKLYILNPSLEPYLKQKIKKENGLAKLVLSYCLNENDIFISEFKFMMNHNIYSVDQLSFIRGFKHYCWGNSEIFNILKDYKNRDYLTWILDTIRINNIKLEISISDIKDVINMLETIEKSYKYENYIKYVFGEILLRNTSEDIKMQLLQTFNEDNFKYRTFLGKFFIAGLKNRSTDDLSESAINFLLSQLYIEKINVHNNPLSKLATEQFIENKIIPLIRDKSEPLCSNIKNILNYAGERHRKRYI